jgi:hypothetical protein
MSNPMPQPLISTVDMLLEGLGAIFELLLEFLGAILEFIF